MSHRLFLAITSALLTVQAFAGDVRISLPGGGALVLHAPSGWRQAREAGSIPTVSLTPEGSNAFQVMVSPLVKADGTMPPADPESLRRLVSTGAQGALSQSVEKSLPVQELRGTNVSGSFFSATDRAPKPNEFKYLTQGALAVEGLPVTFTILSNGDPQAALEPALRMLKAARRERP